MFESEYRYRHALARAAMCRVELVNHRLAMRAGDAVDDDRVLSVAADLHALDQQIRIYEKRWPSARPSCPTMLAERDRRQNLVTLDQFHRAQLAKAGATRGSSARHPGTVSQFVPRDPSRARLADDLASQPAN